MAQITESVDVAVPVRTAYNQWTQFEEFPRFMDGVEEIRQTDDTHLHWVAEFGGKREEWDAEVTEQHPDERVAWTARSGKGNAGVVTFHRLDEDSTRVTVQMDWEPEGVLENVGATLGFDDRQVSKDLGRFKEMIEDRGTSRAAGAARSTPADAGEGAGSLTARSDDGTGGPALSNGTIGDLLLRASAGEADHRRRALERAARAARFWPEEAADLAAAGRELTELRAVGPWVGHIVSDWLDDPPPAVEPDETRRGYLTFAEVRRVLDGGSRMGGRAPRRPAGAQHRQRRRAAAARDGPGGAVARPSRSSRAPTIRRACGSPTAWTRTGSPSTTARSTT